MRWGIFHIGTHAKTLVIKQFLEAKSLNLVEELWSLKSNLPEEKQADIIIALMPYLYHKRAALKPDEFKALEESELENLSDDELRKEAAIVLERGEGYKREEPEEPRAKTTKAKAPKPRAKPKKTHR